MPKQLKRFLGLFLLTLILIGCIGQTNPPEAAASCPSLEINSHPPLTQVPPNSRRDRISLNGIWQFIPANANTSQTPPAQGWGKIQVPGDWQREGHEAVPGLVERGTGEAWDNLNGYELERAWYRRKIAIPSDWQGRAIALHLNRLSTDAKVYVNNTECGALDWPGGAVDLSKFAQPGQEITVDLFVVAAADEADKLVVMSPNEIYSEKRDKQLDSRGLIGEVELLSFPRSGYINDVFVQPSVRDRQLKLEISLRDIQRNQTLEFNAVAFNEKGEPEQEWTTSAKVQAKPEQTLQVTWDWENPRLWDIEKPNLYTLRLQVRGEGIEDEYDQSFGFREFWIEGKKFYLNGREIRLRPVLHEDNWRGWGVGTPQVADAMFEGYRKVGYNIAQLWPWNYRERGRWHFREIIADRADLQGFPLIAPALDTVGGGYTQNWDAQTQSTWEEKMTAQLRRDRNHPSILMWANSPNYFGHSDDQNPRRIGMQEFAGGLSEIENQRMEQVIPIANDAIATVKKHDPTRPVFLHQGASTGDVYALNSYLNLIPLQEREEWLSHWAKAGEMPYMVVEFGTPLHASMMRGRNGFGGAIVSEPLMTEFSAIYLGKEAYQLETPAYRQKIRDSFVKNQEYQNWHNQPELDFAPAFQKLQNLFITHTWRSWRTWGITGGTIPWHDGHGWEITPTGREKVSLEESNANRGPALEKVDRYLLNYLQPPSYKIHAGGKAIIANNGSTLAWIAGRSENFTEKGHNFRAGAKLQKQAVLINDAKTAQDFSLSWEVKVNQNRVAQGEESGKIETAQTLFFPIEAQLPEAVAEKAKGEVILNARIGSVNHQDRFPFRVFAEGTPASVSLVAIDPVGKTRQMLQQLGYSVSPWDGSMTDSLLIIGREALSSQPELLKPLKSFLEKGGRAVLFTQTRAQLERLGFRVAHPLSRRVFPVNSNQGAIAELDAEDLRDWQGESTLIEAYPDTVKTPAKRSPVGTPWYGWHWGNQGALSSAAIEKPHLSGWRPILETEFDLAYSPLMELDYGKGRLILNTLDVEDHFSQDAAARQLLHQLLAYGVAAPLAPRAETVLFVGNEAEAEFLKTLGVVYQKVDSFSRDADLMIVGEEVEVSNEALRAYLEGGGRAFFLARNARSHPWGVSLKEVPNFDGSLNVPPWPEMAGISASDLRSRTGYETHLIETGGEVGADGLLSRVKLGEGTAIFSQLDPQHLQADDKTHLRYTRWRHTRAIAQILANLGATFKTDTQFFEPPSSPISYYHPDYRTDFELGDDPYRYYRW
jgi:beta-galactosidase